MRTIHCDNAKEFRGTVIGRACQDHDIAIDHRPPREPRYGGHIERGFGTWLTRARRLKGITFSNVEQKGDYDSEGRAIMTRAELEKWFTIYVARRFLDLGAVHLLSSDAVTNVFSSFNGVKLWASPAGI